MSRRSHTCSPQRRNDDASASASASASSITDSGCCRRKITVVDRISMLPNSTLIHILSFLPTIEESIKTHVLSKRWKYLWTKLPSLVISHRFHQSCDTSYETTYDFIRSVDKTLLLWNSSVLKKFVLDFDYKLEFASNINSWINFATRNAAEELQLRLHILNDDLSEDELFVLPQELFTNSSFRELLFSRCSLMREGVVCWKLLKTLSISYVKLGDGVIDKILEGSPVLENLELYYFYGFSHLHISKASLKNLILREFWHSMGTYDCDGGRFNEFWDFDLEISTPNLQSLEISGFLGRMNCRLADVSSLVDANLNCYLTSYVHDVNDDYEWHQNVLRGLLESLVHVKNLTLGSWALKVLSIMEMKGLRSPLSKCECLTLDTKIEESVLPGIANILESSFHLETLVITMSPFMNDEYSYNNLTQPFNFNGEHYWTSQKKVFKCLMMCLKIVKFAGLRWNCCDFYFSFVQFLLKNSRVLQKMVVMVDCIPQKEHFQAAQRFLSFPRSSPDAIIMFN